MWYLLSYQNHTDGAVALTGSNNPYDPAASTVPVFLDQLMCTGTENTIQGCNPNISPAGFTTCTHTQDSATSCQIKACEQTHKHTLTQS